MNILVISNIFPPEILGGFEISCSQVADGLGRRGHNVTVLTTGVPTDESDRHFDLRRELYLSDLYRQVGTNPEHHHAVEHAARVSCCLNVWQVLKAIRALRPDIVYAFNLLGLGIMNFVDTFNETGMPWAWHLGDAVPVEALLRVNGPVREAFACGAGDFSGARIIAVSERLHGEIKAAGIDLGKNVSYVPYWGIVGGKPPSLAKQNDTITRFVNAGTLAPHKGVDLILEASALLVARGRKEFVVDLIGLAGPGDYSTTFKERVRESGIDAFVRFLGPKPQQELYALYSAYDCFLFPTWYREPFGMAPVEAAGMGCPPIITYGCGAAEWFVDEVHCLKIRREAPVLADAMERLMDDPPLRQNLSRRARHLADTSLDFEYALDRIERILENETRVVDWQAIDWENLYRRAYDKDRLALARCVDGA